MGAPPSGHTENSSQKQEDANHVAQVASSSTGNQVILGGFEDPAPATTNDSPINHLGAMPSECADNSSQEQQDSRHVPQPPYSSIGDETILGAFEAPALITTVTQDDSNAPTLGHAPGSKTASRVKKARDKIEALQEELRTMIERAEELRKANAVLESSAEKQDTHICSLQQGLQELKDRDVEFQELVSLQQIEIGDLVEKLGMAAEKKASLEVALASATSDNAQLKETIRAQKENINLLDHEARSRKEKEATKATTTKHAEERISQPTSMTDSQLKAEFPALFSTRLMTYDNGSCQSVSDEEEKIEVEAYNTLIAIRDEVVYGIRR